MDSVEVFRFCNTCNGMRYMTCTSYNSKQYDYRCNTCKNHYVVKREAGC